MGNDDEGNPVVINTERVRREAVERVARQLCLSEGNDPDEPFPANPIMSEYRERAEKMLRNAFR